MSLQGTGRPLRLLALDDGCIRGLSELSMINRVMYKLRKIEDTRRRRDGEKLLTHNPMPCDYFDMIGGTGTGGIIALMLGRLQMSVGEALWRYLVLSEKSFSNTERWKSGTFDAATLEESIKWLVKRSDFGPDSELSLIEDDQVRACRVFVCANNVNTMNVTHLFRSYEVPGKPTPDCKIWEAARATSATPIFFEPIQIGKECYANGGGRHSNPSQLILEEAKNLYPGRHVGCFVSIGSGHTGTISVKERLLSLWVIPTKVIQTLKRVALDCEHGHEDTERRFSKWPNSVYFRLNDKRGLERLKLSKWEEEIIVDQHTKEYLEEAGGDEKITSLANALNSPKAQITIEQLV